MHYEQFQDGSVKCIEDEIPFELPSNWEWSRLQTICVKEIKRGKSPKYAEKSNTLVFAQKCNTKAGFVDISKAKFLNQSLLKKYTYEDYLFYDDIIINSTGTGTLGRIGIFTESDDIFKNKIVPDSHITLVRVISSGINAKYMYYFLKYHQCYFENSGIGSTNQKELKPDVISKFLVAIPPIREQKDIATKIDISNECLFDLDNEKKETKALISALKSKILNLAITGKLVLQDPNDEPASVLLERIRAEKEELIKQSKIKRDNKESVIFKGDDNSYYEKIGSVIKNIDNEIQFELPNGWIWSRITGIADIIMGSSPKGVTIKNSEDGMEFHQGKIAFTNKVIAESGKVTTAPIKIAPPNSVLLCVRAPVGEVNITDRKVCIGRGLAAITPIGELSIDFLFYWLRTYKEYLSMKATGSTFAAITADTLKGILLPIPPISEQKKIVDTILKLNSELKNVSSKFN